VIRAHVTPAAYDQRATAPGNVWRAEYDPAILRRLERAVAVTLTDGVRTVTRVVISAWRYIDTVDEQGRAVGGINVLLGKVVKQ